MTGPILFYTGNESPVEVYINNTGLMWALAPKLNALMIFAEHRYEGESFPALVGVPDCMSHCTSAEALADFAALITAMKREMRAEASRQGYIRLSLRSTAHSNHFIPGFLSYSVAVFLK